MHRMVSWCNELQPGCVALGERKSDGPYQWRCCLAMLDLGLARSHLASSLHRSMLVAEHAGPAARKLRLQGLQLAANEFWAHLCDFSVAPSAARLTQQVCHGC